VEDPFAGLRSGSTASNVDRYVTAGEAEAVLAALPDSEWKLLFGLGRYAGLRVPSESESLTWADVDWQGRRLLVRSPKTEGHAGQESREVPISLKLMALLRSRFEEAGKPASSALLVAKRGGNVVRKVRAAIKRAGVADWPDLWQVCRASCEKQWLAEVRSEFAANKWAGHSQRVSRSHYTKSVPDELYDVASGKAAQNAAQQAAESGRNGSHAEISAGNESSVTPQALAYCRKCLQNKELEAEGIEPSSQDNADSSLYMLR
jgi:integrase